MRLRRGYRVGVVATTAALLCGGVVWLAARRRGDNWPELKPAPVATSAAVVRVRTNVYVSSAFETTDHMGCAITADPTDPQRLFAASTLGDTYDDVAGYYSHDGGETWHLGCKRPHRAGEQVSDEDVAFGPDGGLFFVNMRTPRETPGSHRYGTEGVGTVDFGFSPDGGKTWEDRASVPRYVDRPCLAVDRTSGLNRGRLYVHATVEEPIVFASTDAARSFAAAVPLAPAVRSTRPSNPVVLADGTVLVTSAVFVTGSDAHLELPLWRSVDGGRSFVQVTPNLAGRWKHPRIKSASVFGVFYPRLAVHPGSPAFAGRLYCVWRDGHGSDETYILLSSSGDGGASWSAPVVVSEQAAGGIAAPDYAADVPAVAVNRDGVVAVTWYDRRGLPWHVVGPGGVIPPAPGYNARLRVSLDGGATWQASVQLNSVAMKGNVEEARYWTGLAAAADGRFHAAWIGDATGKRQVWAAAVEVRAAH
jgi:hypothetical protein